MKSGRRVRCRLWTAIAIAIAFVSLVPARAEAYLDSGNSGIIINLILSAIFGMLFYIRSAMATVRRWLRIGRQSGSPNPAE